MISVYRGSNYFEAQLLANLIEMEGLEVFYMVLPFKVVLANCRHWTTFPLWLMMLINLKLKMLL